jgi:hypothetical protein
MGYTEQWRRLDVRPHAGEGMRNDELIGFIFGVEASAVAVRCASWMAESERFAAFVQTHRDKIRKKGRALRDEEGRLDLLLELETAYRLLGERRFALAYEPYLAGKTRGPDFTVTYKTWLAVNVEVKRIRSEANSMKLENAACAKLGQLPAGSINVLLMAGEQIGCVRLEAQQAMGHLRELAEHKLDGYFTQRGFAGAKDYLRRSLQLSAVVFRAGWAGPDGGQSYLWVNPQAKHPLPDDLRKALERCFVNEQESGTRP